MQKYKISVVSYLNSVPFIYGLKNLDAINDFVDISLDYPAVCAEKLKSSQVDIGLIPVAEFPNVPNANIISDYCIGASGDVKTVLLLSDVPIDEIERVYLDYQSRTSVALLQLLYSHFSKKNFNYIKAYPNYEQDIKGKDAGLVIGDRCFHLADRFKYAYDLSREWQRYTNMPFVFATWVANREVNPEFVKLFNSACKLGIDNFDKVVEQYQNNNFVNRQRLMQYFQNDISYIFDADKQKAMKHFLDLIKK